jgi:hypothetical protein
MKRNFYLMFMALGILIAIQSCTPPPPTGKIVLQKTQFEPGEEIKINFTAEGNFGESPWIGIIPSEVKHGSEEENDANDLTYQYFTNMTEGEMTFNAPQEPGSYDFRMNSADGDGIEITSVTFTVVAPPPPPEGTALLLLNKTEFTAGEEIVVSYSAPESYEERAWIGIIPSDTPHGSEATNDGVDLAYEYLKKRTNGEIKFTAPSEPGAYDIRMHDSDSDGKEVASKSFVVK